MPLRSSSTTIFLEEWLETITNSSKTPAVTPNPPARSIIQSWSDLRLCLQRQSFQSHHLLSLQSLLQSKTSIHVADPQAKLIVSILSSRNITLPPQSYPLFLRLLYIWVRKSLRPSLALIDSALNALKQVLSGKLLSTSGNDHLDLFAQSILVLGAFSLVPNLPDGSKVLVFDLLCRILEGHDRGVLLINADRVVSDVLAGIGYGLSSCSDAYFGRIFNWLLCVWCRKDGLCFCVNYGLMILHLIEWVVSGYIKSFNSEKLRLLRDGLESVKVGSVLFSIAMASAGVLRALSRSVPSAKTDLQIISSLRTCSEINIESIGQHLISRTGLVPDLENDCETNVLLQCFALALARAGPVSPRGPLFLSLCLALLMEVYPLRKLYGKILKSLDNDLGNEVRVHVDGILFKEAGAVSGVFCNLYVSMDKENRAVVESRIWQFCQELYSGHRQVAMLLRGKDDELLRNIEKIAESAFLMVVMFSLAVTKHKLNLKQSTSHMETSVSILISFSFLEYFRRIRLPEYMDTVRGVVLSMQESENACVSFLGSMPSYVDLIKPQEFMQKLEYMWFKDEVQTARILFYLRVIPTLIERVPGSVFSRVIAPSMFLFMDHQNSKVARAAHSLYVAFLSSGRESDGNEGLLLKEKLSFHYIKKSLEGYPNVTPFDGMASGVAALVRYLPAGSPAIFYSIHSLVGKEKELVIDIPTQEADIWKSWQGEAGPSKKLMELLLRLVSIVDVQVLPYLMKLLAQLIVQLPKDGKNIVLDGLYILIAESDDLTRKPALVSWVQSLSYLCSEAQNTKTASRNTKGDISTFTKEPSKRGTE